MTFSVVAYCHRTGQVGVGATTASQAVGKLACHAIANVGAIASQAMLNPYLAYDGLRLLERKIAPEETLKRIMAGDPGAENRQVGIVDKQGRTAVWTGSKTIDWSGQREGRHFSAQGNRLAGPRVLEQVVQAMQDNEHLDLAERFMLALQAGADAGGDKKGERSANILVFAAEEYPLCDIRIDDHDDAMQELQRLFGLYRKEMLPIVKELPKRADMPRPVS